jgi:hypothetical protein
VLTCVKQALGAAVGDGGKDREAERAADLLRGVDQPRRQSGLVWLCAGHCADRHRHEGEAQPEGSEQRWAEHVRAE